MADLGKTFENPDLAKSLGVWCNCTGDRCFCQTVTWDPDSRVKVLSRAFGVVLSACNFEREGMAAVECVAVKIDTDQRVILMGQSGIELVEEYKVHAFTQKFESEHKPMMYPYDRPIYGQDLDGDGDGDMYRFSATTVANTDAGE